MSEYLGKEFHRRSALDADKAQQKASTLLKQSTRGENLQEWFNREKQKPAPKAEDDHDITMHMGKQEKGIAVDAREEKKPANTQKADYDPDCIICQNEGPRDNNNGKHQHVYSE